MFFLKGFSSRVVVSWMIAVTMFLSAYIQFFQSPVYAIVCVLLVLFSLVITYPVLTNETQKSIPKVFGEIFALWIWCVILSFAQGAIGPYKLDVLEMLLYSAIMTFLLCRLKLSVIPLKIVLYAIIIFFLYQYFVVGIESYGVNDTDSGAINTIILFSIAITIQVLDYRDNHVVTVLPSILIVPIAIMSWNRTGFFTSILFLLTTIYYGVSFIRIRRRRFFLYTLSFALLLLVIYRYNIWFTESALFTKFEDNGMNLGRTSIWASYFENFDFAQLIAGRAIDEAHTLTGGYINSHNSFIMLHAQTGLFALFIIFVTIKKLKLYWINNKLIFFWFIVLILRSFFDMMYFFHLFDYSFFVFLFSSNELCIKPKDVKIKII